MSIQRKVTPQGKVRYRARIKANGREVASRMFGRKSDAVAWEQDQRQRLRAGEWLDPRRGQVPLNVVGEMWLESRRTVNGGRWKVTAGHGGTTSLRGSGVGQWHRSLRQRSRAGLAT